MMGRGEEDGKGMGGGGERGREAQFDRGAVRQRRSTDVTQACRPPLGCHCSWYDRTVANTELNDISAPLVTAGQPPTTTATTTP